MPFLTEYSIIYLAQKKLGDYMKKIEFRGFDGSYCAFTDSSVILANRELNEAKVYPLGSIAKLSAAGVLKIVTHSGETAVFSVRYMHKKSKAKIKELVEDANSKKSSYENLAPFTEPIDDAKKKRIERIHIPHRSKKKIVKFWLIVVSVICALLILACFTVGFVKSRSSNDSLAREDVRLSWENLW